MREWQSLSHVNWECKYHVVIVLKNRKKEHYGRLRGEVRKIICESASDIDPESASV